MWRMRRAIAALSVPWIAMAGSPCLADTGQGVLLDGQGSLVVILGMEKCCAPEAWPEAEKKTQVELMALHFRVVVVQSKATGDASREDELEAIGAREGAAAVLRITRSASSAGGSVDAWVRDPGSGKTVIRHAEVSGLDVAESESVIALRAVELVRSAMIDLVEEAETAAAAAAAAAAAEEADVVAQVENWLALAPEPEIKVEKPVAVPVPEPSARPVGFVGLRAGFAGLGTPGSDIGLGSVDIALRWNVVPAFALELDCTVSVAGSDIARSDMGSTFDSATVRAWVLWDFLMRKVVRLGAGMGAGLLVAWSKGFAPEGYEVKTDNGIAAWFGGTLQSSFALSRHLWLRLGFTLGATLPGDVVVRFSGEKVASWGRPILEGFVGLEARLP